MKSEKKLTSELPGSSSSWKEMLTARPVRNMAADAKIDGDELRISVPTKPAWWYNVPPVCWIVHPAKARIFILDRVGRPLWDWCDGERTVEQLVDLFAEKHNLTFHESRVSVTNYLRLLIARGALAVAL
jgi:hypothetical protein